MKASALMAPLVLTGLIFAAVWAIGMMALRSSAMATETSLQMLRFQIEARKLQEALATHSRQRLVEDLNSLEARAAEISELLPATDTSEPLPAQ
ncbi:MAG: hypothetical protein AAF657_10035 [Acidobacteriota bacterium]